jgi:hypothetical protein
MRRPFAWLFSAVAVGIVSLFGVSAAHADLAARCPEIRDLGPCQYKNNSPIRACSALSCPISRFALNPTIIFTNDVGRCGDQAKLGTANILDSAGNIVCRGARRLFCADNRGTCLSRYKASEITCNTRRVRGKAVRNTQSPTIYWKVSPTVCYEVPDAGKCYNVKKRDFCDGRIVR